MTEEDRSRALSALRGISAEGPNFDEHRRKILLPAQQGSKTLMEALRRLDVAGLTFEDVSLHKPTLNDVILSLTGHVATSGNSHGGTTSAPRRGQDRVAGG